MIIGKLKELSRYKGIDKNLDTAIEYITNNDLNVLKYGRNEIDGDNVFINRFSYAPLDEENCFFEGHKNYLDIHIVLDGKELLGYSDISDLVAVTEYDSINDFIKYEGNVNTYCKLESGRFAITFPEDIHMPKVKISEKIIEKVVCKVLVK